MEKEEGIERETEGEEENTFLTPTETLIVLVPLLISIHYTSPIILFRFLRITIIIRRKKRHRHYLPQLRIGTFVCPKSFTPRILEPRLPPPPPPPEE